MDRRGLLRGLLSGVLATFAHSSCAQASSSSNGKRYVVRIKCRSLKYPDRIFKSVDEFWSYHPDPNGKKVSEGFAKAGLMKSLDSHQAKMINGGKAMEIEFSFPSYLHKTIYCLAYRRESKANPKLLNIEYYDQVVA